MKDLYENAPQDRPELAVLVGLKVKETREEDFRLSMKEMVSLAEAVNVEVVSSFEQNLPAPISATYIGSGKIEEIRAYIEMKHIDLVLVNDSISPKQQKNLSDDLGGAEVMDRTGLILSIFSERARTREATLQVEYAKLSYMLPRLQGMHRELGRQGGASGAMSNKGAGEKKIELDRRRIEHRMGELHRELDAVSLERETQRKKRMSSGMRRVSLVGYTNAGKSTIMNGLLGLYGSDEDKQVLEKDMLFATLDTTVRKIDPGKSDLPFLLSDTVGFISNLPTSLIKSFRSTLEEASYADLLLIVADLSNPDYREDLRVTLDTLKDIGAGEIPRLFIFNKKDLAAGAHTDTISVPGMTASDGRITISAKDPADLARLVAAIEQKLSENSHDCRLLVPYTDGASLDALIRLCRCEVVDYTADGSLVKGKLGEEDYQRYQKYLAE
ncbi:MAG: GTPase HflX [Lachnospiraceae bacterium]|nr:GTPase HflX [Lachnospiraceae bacterium]